MRVRVALIVAVLAVAIAAPATRHREMAAQIPGATLALIPECGHMCTLERPEAVTRALLDWQARAG